MGKISDAFDRHNNEKFVKLEDLKQEEPRILHPEEPETNRARQISAENRFSDSLVILSSPESADAESFKILRGQILFAKNRQMPRSILVTSAFPGEGKTFVAANLAVSLALSVDEYVLAIDADLRRPRLHKMFGYGNVAGLHELLVGSKKFDEIIFRSKIRKLSVVPSGRVPRNPTELLSSNMMRDFLQDARNRYKDRFIIIDSPPSHITAETKSLAQQVDGIVFVVMARKTPRRDVQKAIENLGEEKILGIVFNGYEQARKSYRKYYDRYYKKK
jgi:protein-tyrosine kinase